jgi:hypothetical protein
MVMVLLIGCQDMEDLDELFEFVSQGENFDTEFEEESYEEAVEVIDVVTR